MAKYQELADAIIKGDNVASKELEEKLVAAGYAADAFIKAYYRRLI